MGTLSNIRSDSARRRDYKWQLDRANSEVASLTKVIARQDEDIAALKAFIRHLMKRFW